MPTSTQISYKKSNGISVSPYSTVFPDDQILTYVTTVLGSETNNILWMQTDTSSNVLPIQDHLTSIGNLLLINDIPELNKYFRKVNVMLDKNGYFILVMETKKSRKKRIFGSYSKPVRRILYLFDFIWKRILPKSFLKRFYFWVSKGKNRVISFSEALARLIFCGFEIVDYHTIGHKTIIITQKKRIPYKYKEPTTGIIIKLPRIGMNGSILNVYKLRTMHPYSEFLQEYLFEKNGTRDGDKITNDFRVTRWGKFFRKFWLDEVPMLINFLKRDLKLIGVRPLSVHKFNTYPEYLQKERIKFKPGMIPPYYADLPKTPDEFYESEKKYLQEYSRKPIITDLKYLCKSLFNIIFKGIRSR